MGITDELRAWADGSTVRDVVLTTYPEQHAVHGILETLLEIADRIDKQHDEELSRLYRDMSDAEWVKLPVDADGEVIHIGDQLDPISPDYASFYVELMYLNSSNHWEIATDLDGEWSEDEFSQLRHHHGQFIEDVLREFADSVDGQNKDFRELLIAEYSKRMRLAECEERLDGRDGK